MVQFAELCAWKMPGAAKTQMRDVGKMGLRDGGCVGLERAASRAMQRVLWAMVPCELPVHRAPVWESGDLVWILALP